MKKIFLTFFAVLSFSAILLNSCKQSELEDLYPDPSKSSTATVDNFFTGILQQSNEVVEPWYWRFFVVEQPTLGHYTQTMGWFNGKDQYIPSSSSMDWRWDIYYNGAMTQYRELERLYNKMDDATKQDYRIFYLASKIFFYDQTEQVVDLFGDIPWSEAGKIRDNGDLTTSLPKYDSAETIYTTMIDDLKSVADELSAIQVPSFYANLFKAKDYLNNGDVNLWKKYCNSLRLRMLMRISDANASKAQAGIAEILSNSTKYPVIDNNAENIMLDAGGPDLYATTKDKTGGIRSAMETWGQYDIAPYSMVKYLADNNDPRLPVIFDANKNGEYIGMDPLDNESVQNQKLIDGLVSRYDTSTFTRNNFFPGFVISAAEVSFIKAEAYQRGMATGNAKAAYETGIKQSIEFYYAINATGDYRDPLPAPTEDELNAYISGAGIAWDSNSDKIGLIASQKWVNSGLGGMPQTWAELRRLDKPVLTFLVDNSSQQTKPPVRWLYPNSEKKLNATNYSAVASKDNLNTKLFWDKN
jgi:hypothetical protein